MSPNQGSPFVAFETGWLEVAPSPKGKEFDAAGGHTFTFYNEGEWPQQSFNDAYEPSQTSAVEMRQEREIGAFQTDQAPYLGYSSEYALFGKLFNDGQNHQGYQVYGKEMTPLEVFLASGGDLSTFKTPTWQTSNEFADAFNPQEYGESSSPSSSSSDSSLARSPTTSPSPPAAGPSGATATQQAHRRSTANHQCQHCPKWFSHIRQLNRHVSSVHTMVLHPCTSCFKVFKRLDVLRRHETDKHGRVPLRGHQRRD